MAFFKFRKGGADDSAAAAAPPESVEVLRRRARHRLIGAAVLVLVGVVGFPLLFDTQPRPVAVDIPIEIPDRAKAKPLPAPVPVAKAPVASEHVASAEPASAPAAAKPASVPAVAKAASAPSRPVAAGAITAAPEAKPEPRPEPKAEAKAETAKAVAAASKPAAPVKPEARRTETARSDDGTRAQSLLEGKPVEAKPVQASAGNEAAAKGVRYVVQVGAFSDAAKAREAQRKLEKAGLKNYTNVADTKDGKRTRVRAGPYDSKAEAEKAAGKVKELELPAAILTL
ncbi:SPOR domain-containing protein [Ramlibacter humi]|uniref:SPOR domain-containing protein n=1 Tax=Ramlibacter humi TaxID=2530451 RepID=A0A4Z0BN60_9BURK|nr:SPOR domain-containing protein [Ramlibacter humi]TFZ00212.1 SPOR domain-containing protein [Ramlibacter humi]